jgi:hypothetical protein
MSLWVRKGFKLKLTNARDRRFKFTGDLLVDLQHFRHS